MKEKSLSFVISERNCIQIIEAIKEQAHYHGYSTTIVMELGYEPKRKGQLRMAHFLGVGWKPTPEQPRKPIAKAEEVEA